MGERKNKKILVYDVAAENGGGLFVLKDFYADACRYAGEHEDVTFVFITSLPLLEESERVEVLSFPWIKKSWAKRLYFEKKYVKKLLKELKPDCIVSLQNTTVAGYKGEQYVYMHQSLQYCVKRFSLFKKRERALAIRQRFICGGYKSGLKKATRIYVQTDWIKEATQKWIKAEEGKVRTIPVTLSDVPSIKFVYSKENVRQFFYPARAETYKNHQLILEACALLRERGVDEFRVYFTIDRKENAYAAKIVEKAKDLPIDFIGGLSRECVFQKYAETVLLFPSYLETCGLPLLEARAVGSIVLAADMSFAREALQDYANARYFNYTNAEELADCMEACITGKTEYISADKAQGKQSERLLSAMLQDMEQENEK